MDCRLVHQYQDEMPNLTRLCEMESRSVFPPDSDTAWASIYTGVNPAKHGIVNFVDPIEKSYNIIHKEADKDAIEGNTFWDIASENGKKVCILYPHLAYPPWNVNGIMVSRSRVTGQTQICPSSHNYIVNGAIVPPIGLQRRDASHTSKLIRQYVELLAWECDFFIKMKRESDWDLFFCYSSILDAIQHFFWPTYESTEPIAMNQLFKKFYVLYDEFIVYHEEQINLRYLITLKVD